MSNAVIRLPTVCNTSASSPEHGLAALVAHVTYPSGFRLVPVIAELAAHVHPEAGEAIRMIIELPANAARVCRVAGFQVLFPGLHHLRRLLKRLQQQPLGRA